MKLLFISRSFPPVVGGIERQNAEIARALAQVCGVRVIANRRGKYLLPLFLPWATLQALLFLPRHDAVLLGDGVLGITGFILKLFTRKPVLCITHGLDLTYANRIYQLLWVRTFLPRLDKLIAVGNATIAEGSKRGIPAARFTFIPNGVTPTSPGRRRHSRNELATLIGREPGNTILLTVGRLVRRKGVAWFVNQVMPFLTDDITYVVAGTGPDYDNVSAAASRHGLRDRVILLGSVTEADKELLFETADIFIQPNIPVDGDIEGFGLVVLEAAAHGLLVIAANLEGLRDAIRDGENGFLVTPADAAAYRMRIDAVLADRAGLQVYRDHARKYTLEHYDWSLIAQRYHEQISELLDRQNFADPAG